MHNKALLIAFLLGLILFLPTHQPAMACSGGGDGVSLDTAIDSADVVVEATIIETDDAGKNLILQVSQYLKGSGSEYVLLYRTDPALSASYDGRHYDTACNYGGANPLASGPHSYFALSRLLDGVYAYSYGGEQLESLLWEGGFPATFPTKIDPTGSDDPDNWASTEFTTAPEFADWVLDISNSKPTPPTSYDRPRLRPLLITTVTGSTYILPIDGGAAVPVNMRRSANEYSPYAYPNILLIPPFCSTDISLYCLASTPDDSLIATFAGEDEPYINVDFYPYVGEYPNPSRELTTYDDEEVPAMPLKLTGQAFAFSSTGEAFMVWDRGTLSVYLVNNQWCYCSAYGELAPRLDLLAAIPLEFAGEDGGVRWSADGSTMAYADHTGLWVFDIFRMAAPQLLVEGAGLKPLYLSTSGRYVGYQSAQPPPDGRRAEDEWLVVDRMTGNDFENAIFSPDERYMAQIAPPTPVELGDDATCTAPLTTTCPLVMGYVPQQFEWTAISGHYYAVQCSSNGICDLRSGSADYLDWESTAATADLPTWHGTVIDVAYDSESGIYAVAQATHILLFAPDPINEYLEDTTADLGNVLDGEIVDVAWLPSLFYRENSVH